MNRLHYIFEELMNNLKHSQFIVTVTVLIIAFAFLLLGLFALLSYNFANLLEEEKSKMQLLIFLEDTVKHEQIDELQQILQNFRYTLDLQFESKEEAYQKHIAQYPEETTMLEELPINPFPASFAVRLNVALQQEKEALQQFRVELESIPFVEEVFWGEPWLALLERVTEIFLLIRNVLYLVISFGVVFLVSSTVRLSLFARQKQIQVMQDQGADNVFIDLPFILEGMLESLIGFGIAFGLLYAAFIFLQTVIPLTFLQWQHLLVMVLLSLSLGWGGSWFSLRKVVRR